MNPLLSAISRYFPWSRRDCGRTSTRVRNAQGKRWKSDKRNRVLIMLERLEDRLVPAVTLTYGGPATALVLTESTPGATPTVQISEPTAGTLEIDLVSGQTFSASSTKTATGLAYQNAGSPSTSQYATVDISTANDITALKPALAGDTLNLGPIYDAAGGLGSITASAAVINVNGVSTAASNGNVSLAATGALSVASNSVLYTGLGTISLAADVNANGTGDSDTTDALAIQSGAIVTTSNSSSSAITLRGAAVNIDTSSDPARVGSGTSGLSTTPTATLTGLSGPVGLALDNSGDLFVANYHGASVSEFAPGSTTPTATLTGLTGPQFMAFDQSGNLFVGNVDGTTVSEFAPGSTTPTATLTGLDQPVQLAFDGSGDLFAANQANGTVSEFAPGATSPTATLMGLDSPYALAFDKGGNLFAANFGNGTVSEFAPGSTTPTTTFTGLNEPDALAFDSNGDLFVANYGGTTVSEFAPGSTTPTATLTGLNNASALAFDQSGNLFVANYGGTTVDEFAPGSTTPTTTLTGVANSLDLAFDSSGDLFVGNYSTDTVSEFANNANTFGSLAGGVVIRAALSSETMSIGGSASGANINLTSAELAQIFTTATGTITFGDTKQTGTITFQDATPATTSGASLVVQQAATGAGQIVLDASSGIALSAGRGKVALNAGKSGIASKITNSTAEIASTGTVTLNTTGAIGSASNPIQFDGTATPASVVVGSSQKPSSIYLSGLGNLTLGNISAGASATLDVTAANALTLAAKAMLSTGTGNASLSAGTSFSNAGTLTVNGATLTITGAMTQLSGTTLTGGTWIVNANSNLNFPAGSNITSLAGANVTLKGANSNFAALANLASIGKTSSFSLLGGQSFTTTGSFTNNGKLTVGPGSTLTANGSFTQASTASLAIQLGGTSSSPTFGQLVSSSGTVTLAGTLQVTSTVVPAVGSSFEILANDGGSPISGTFKGLAEGATFTVKSGSTTMTYKISYIGGGGNNVVITRIS